jgi:hypothetical protein
LEEHLQETRTILSRKRRTREEQVDHPVGEVRCEVECCESNVQLFVHPQHMAIAQRAALTLKIC